MANQDEMQTIPFGSFDWKWDGEDKDATFKQEVALYSLEDPMTTIETMSRNLSIPVGAIVRYVLAKWAASGSSALIEIGPRVVQQMADILDEAERSGDDQARLEAYRKLSGLVSWLNVPLTDPNWRPGGSRKG